MKLIITLIIGLIGLQPVFGTEIPKPITTWLNTTTLDNAQIQIAPINGLYEIKTGSKIYYITADAQHLLMGDLIDLSKKINLSKQSRMQFRKQTIAAHEPIAFTTDQQQHKITVFTDIECGYCRKLHADIKQYNDLGITINYLFYPGAGLGSSAFDMAVSVWCNADRNTAMTRAKAGEQLPEAHCDNPVEKHYRLGNELGITGTPTLVNDQGTVFPGYIPASQLKQLLDQEKMRL